jgi:hypothetical protein
VQAVEHAHQVVAGIGERFGGRDVEPRPVIDACLSRRPAGSHDRRLVAVEARERRPFERLRHDDRGRAEPASDVGDVRPPLQLLDHAVQGRKPLADEMGGVAGPEEPQDTGEQPVVVLLPADPRSGAERVHEDVVVGVARGDALEGAAQEHRAVLIGDHHGLLGRQLEGVVHRVVADVAACRLVAEPLTDVSLIGSGPRRERVRRDRPGARHRPVEAKAVADMQQQPRDGRAHVGDRLADERLEPGFIDRPGVHRGHAWSPLSGASPR